MKSKTKFKKMYYKLPEEARRSITGQKCEQMKGKIKLENEIEEIRLHIGNWNNDDDQVGLRWWCNKLDLLQSKLEGYNLAISELVKAKENEN